MKPEIIQTQGWHLATLWNWDYQEAWEFQKQTVERVRDTNEKWLIACSHPDVLTHGRGLQKPKKGQSFELEDFKPQAYPALPVPFFQIERGGGLTFHHPGQLILYPIVKLHPQRLGLSALVDNLLLSVRGALEERSGIDLRRHLTERAVQLAFREVELPAHELQAKPLRRRWAFDIHRRLRRENAVKALRNRGVLAGRRRLVVGDQNRREGSRDARHRAPQRIDQGRIATRERGIVQHFPRRDRAGPACPALLRVPRRHPGGRRLLLILFVCSRCAEGGPLG